MSVCQTASSRNRRAGRAAALALLFVGILEPITPGAAAQPTVRLPPERHPGAGQIIYFVLTDRFENGTTANDTGGGAGDREVHGFDPTAVNFYHGGDFAGLTERLDYLQHLGVTGLWVTPPLKNKAVQLGSAAYHGYWILDFLHIDPHLGTDDDFHAFVQAAHARGLRVHMDIVVNHTADVIQYQGGDYRYRSKAVAPYRDATGQAFDEQAVAFNGLNDPAAFPDLSPQVSFPYVPLVPPAEAQAKHPAWLNDVTLYHNRGNSTFTGEDSVHGDFGGLDDTFTEHPRVVQGMIDIYTHWLTGYDLDGFRLDTVKHVNPEFWQAFAPAIRAAARARGGAAFLHFGEVTNGDPAFLSQWPTAATLDSVLDFGFSSAIRDYVSRGQTAARLHGLFEADDLYTDHDSNADALVTFLGNHDMGRFGYFLRQDNPTAGDARLVDLMELAHGLMFLVRGQPVVYYGDEQGMAGFGGDFGAREDMFASQSPAYANLTRIGTTARGDVAKFSEDHPLFKSLRALAGLRASHAAFRRGAMILRPSAVPTVFAFSRLERNERVEYLVAANNSRGPGATAVLPTAQPPGAELRRIFDSRSPEDPGNEILTVDSNRQATFTLEPLQFAVWRAENALPASLPAPSISFATPTAGSLLTIGSETVDGQTFPSRVEFRAEVGEDVDYAEVTFALVRADHPSHFSILGVDDAPPYRVWWRPPADLAAGATFTLLATADNLRGGRASAEVSGLRFNNLGDIAPGIKGSTTPFIAQLTGETHAFKGATVTFLASATGTPPLEYQWLKDGTPIDGATSPSLKLRRLAAADAGSYALRVRNRAGTTLSAEVPLEIAPRVAPIIAEQPVSATVPPGGSTTFSVGVVASLPVSYQWFKDGVPIAGANSPMLVLSGLDADDNGDYSAVVSAAGESVTSTSARLLVAAPIPGRLVNLSVRARAGRDETTLIAGFVVAGAGPLPVLARGIGPSLADFGVNGALSDPQLAIYGAEGVLPLAANDDWGGDDELVLAFARTGAFALPSASADAALLATLAPGPYTAHLSPSQVAPGVALAEIYEDGSEGTSRLINLSTRSVVGTSDETLIAGFSLNGNVPKRLLVRGIGPALAAFGVGGALSDPILSLYREGEIIPLAGNDDWDGAETLAAAFLEAGAFELAPESLDAAFVITVVPGVYTAHVTGLGGATGAALIEVYELP